MSRVLVLVATIPARKRSCERLLIEIAKQSRVPDGVILALDGYGDSPGPACPLTVVAERRTPTPSGAGQRWLLAAVVADLDDIIVCLDDDIMLCEAPMLIETLVRAVEANGAAAAMGRLANGKFAPPGLYSSGDLLHGLGCGLAVRAKHLLGLQEFAADLIARGGPDALGLGGDDDALVSAYLWKQGVRIQHAATGNIFPAPHTQESATKRKGGTDSQRLAIKKLTGWPYSPQVVGVRRSGARA